MPRIDNVDRFPRTLRQHNQLLGCIPTSIQAVLAYHGGTPVTIQYEGETRTLDESTILEIFARHENPLRICFAAVKDYVLDPYVGDRYVSIVEVKADFGDWLNSVVTHVAKNNPPLISYATQRGVSHIGAVIEANQGDLRIHDPEIGDFVTKPLQEISHIRLHDVLTIRPR